MKFLLLFSLLLTTQISFATEEITFEKTVEHLDERELAELVTDAVREGQPGVEKFLDQQVATGPTRLERLQTANDMASVGVEIVKLFIENRPSITTDFTPLHVLPVENGRMIHPMQLRLAKGTRAARWTITGKSAVGMTVVSFQYTLIYQAGWHKQGRYILNAIMKTNTSLAWGNKFEASMKYIGMANAGTRARPVAQATIKVSYKASSFFFAQEDSSVIRFDALGRVDEF